MDGTNINKHYGRSPEPVDVNTAQVENNCHSPKGTKHEKVATPSLSTSHVHRLPVVAQIDVGGSASIVQLSPSREPLAGTQKPESSTSQPHPEVRKINDKEADNIDSYDKVVLPSHPALSSRPQSSNAGQSGTNVIRLKPSARAVSQPAEAVKKSEQLEHGCIIPAPNLESKNLASIVVPSLPHPSLPVHESTSQGKLADEVSTKPSFQPASITLNPRAAPSASSLLNLLNPISSDTASPFDHHPTPTASKQHLP
jgi:hypothetical protein